jgi:hypothetical protein
MTCPTGKSVTCLSIPLCKNIPVFSRPKSIHIPCRPVPQEGRLAIVTDAGRDAMDADGAFDEQRLRWTAKSCGPDAPTLASSWRKITPLMTVANKPGHRGEHEGNR